MPTKDEQATWQFTGGESDNSNAQAPAVPKMTDSVSWTASEYVEHDKSVGWYLLFTLAAVVIIGGIYLLTRDIFSLILLSVLAIAFGIFAARKPKVLQYTIDNRGVTIGQKLYPVNMFRSFAIIEEGALRSITLLPLKRFMPPVSLYYAPDDEPAILNALGGLLPQETRKQDSIDRLMHRIRF